jgi:hypothetical protein
MLLSGVLFVLFLAGCWLYCLARRKRRSPQRPSADTANLMIIDHNGVNVLWYPDPPTEQESPAGLALPRGPDDDPEFLRQLAQRIHGRPSDSAE